MATNPMAKKARNSFLLGAALMLVIAAIIIVLIIFLIQRGTINLSKEKYAYAFRLTQNVQFGQEITAAMVEPVKVSENAVPIDFFPSKIQVDKKWVDMPWSSIGKARSNLSAGTIMSQSLLYSEEVDSDVRTVEYNMISLPTTVTAGERVDIRFSLGNGTDFIVVAGKEIVSIFGDTITLKLNESEILLMNSAIVEAYLSKTARLYAVQYIDYALQAGDYQITGNTTEEGKIFGTYVPNSDVVNLIKADPNIVNLAKTDFNAENRELIKNQIPSGEEAQTNLEAGVKKQIDDAKKAREAYLNGLTTYGE